MKTTKKNILDCATRLFALYGFTEVSLKDITLEAKVSVGMLNYHFLTKELLLKAILDEFSIGIDKFTQIISINKLSAVQTVLIIIEFIISHAFHNLEQTYIYFQQEPFMQSINGKGMLHINPFNQLNEIFDLILTKAMSEGNFNNKTHAEYILFSLLGAIRANIYQDKRHLLSDSNEVSWKAKNDLKIKMAEFKEFILSTIYTGKSIRKNRHLG